eukprot:4519844-Prorocentrum_lima.AAC.1
MPSPPQMPWGAAFGSPQLPLHLMGVPDWICGNPRCLKDNWAERHVCRECGAERPLFHRVTYKGKGKGYGGG